MRLNGVTAAGARIYRKVLGDILEKVAQVVYNYFIVQRIYALDRRRELKREYVL